MNLRKNEFLVQSFRYSITGGASFAGDYAIYILFSSFLHYEIATYIGLVVGLVINYVLSKIWVFEQKEPVSKREFITFILFTAFGFAFTGVGMYVGVDLMKANDKIVKFIVAVLVFIINFIARKYIIFKKVEG